MAMDTKGTKRSPARYDRAMLRRIARWTMRGIKAVLAVIALAAMFVWPWSFARPGKAGLSCLTLEASTLREERWAVSWSSGRVWLVRENEILWDSGWKRLRRAMAGQPPHWTFMA